MGEKEKEKEREERRTEELCPEGCVLFSGVLLGLLLWHQLTKNKYNLYS